MVAAVSLAILQIWKCSWNRKYWTNTGVILETEGSIWKIQNRALFHYKKVKKGTPNLTSPYVHSLFTIVLIKVIEGRVLKPESVFFGKDQVMLFYFMKCLCFIINFWFLIWKLLHYILQIAFNKNHELFKKNQIWPLL